MCFSNIETGKMAKITEKERVKGGVVVRNAKTGQFISVSTGKSVSVRSPKTGEVVQEASSKRSGALKRLANR
jgi:hypothetical protein